MKTGATVQNAKIGASDIQSWRGNTKQYNPNLVPIGHGFGFIVLMEEIEEW